MAYSIFTREKDTLVYTFTGTKDQLEPLHHIMPKANFEMAKEVVDLQMVLDLDLNSFFLKIVIPNEFFRINILQVAHTYQSLTMPIAEATVLKRKVDMFVVIVDSVARFCRQGNVPVQEFQEYRAKFNDRAK